MSNFTERRQPAPTIGNYLLTSSGHKFAVLSQNWDTQSGSNSLQVKRCNGKLLPFDLWTIFTPRQKNLKPMICTPLEHILEFDGQSWIWQLLCEHHHLGTTWLSYLCSIASDKRTNKCWWMLDVPCHLCAPYDSSEKTIVHNHLKIQWKQTDEADFKSPQFHITIAFAHPFWVNCFNWIEPVRSKMPGR